tara:strand:+ start:827 stop:1063 length:237 start_codon:yes stop_codon:yes gene_type:complete
MKEFLIKHLLAWLAGITAKQWTTALHWVGMAAKDVVLRGGIDKKEAVTKMLKSLWPELQGWALNLLIETAVAFQRRSS